MLRKILLAFAVLILLLVVAQIYFFHRIDSYMERVTKVNQEKLKPGLIKGQGQFEKRVFYAGGSLGNISEILAGWPADREGAALAVVGNAGAHFLDVNGGLKKQVRFFTDTSCPIEVMRLDASGDYGYLTRDQTWAADVISFDKQGQERWRYSEGSLNGIDDSAPGDVDGSGISKVVIGFNGRGGIVLVDGQGKKIWRRPEGNVWHVETLDTKGDGRKEILHSNARGQLLVRNASGEVIARYLPGTYVSDFTLTRWGAESQPSHILVPIRESRDGCCTPGLLVLNARGEIISRLDTPLGDLLDRMKATPVRYATGAEYYAVLKNRGALDRSMLFLYDKQGQIAYQEIIGESCLGIAALPGKLGERLLVGCSGKIWEYMPVLPGGKPQRKSEGETSEQH